MLVMLALRRQRQQDSWGTLVNQTSKIGKPHAKQQYRCHAEEWQLRLTSVLHTYMYIMCTCSYKNDHIHNTQFYGVNVPLGDKYHANVWPVIKVDCALLSLHPVGTEDSRKCLVDVAVAAAMVLTFASETYVSFWLIWIATRLTCLPYFLSPLELIHISELHAQSNDLKQASQHVHWLAVS